MYSVEERERGRERERKRERERECPNTWLVALASLLISVSSVDSVSSLITDSDSLKSIWKSSDIFIPLVASNKESLT